MLKLLSNLICKVFGEKKQEVELLDPVEEFRQKLGLEKKRRDNSWWPVRVLKSAHGRLMNDEDDNFTITLTLAFIIVFALTAFSSIVHVFAFIIALFLAVFLCSKEKKNMEDAVFFYTFLTELLVIGVVGHYMGYPSSWLPFGVFSSLFFYLGIRGARKKVEVVKELTLEERVRELFDEMVQKYRPDLVSRESDLNRNMSLLDIKIGKLNDILICLCAEQEVESKRSSDDRTRIIQAKIDEVRAGIVKLECEKLEHERVRGDILKALQIFEAIKGDALSHIRFESLSSQAEEILSEGMSASERARLELERVGRIIYTALTEMNQLALQAGLNSVARLEDPELKMFEPMTNKVADKSIKREKEISQLKIVG